MSFAHLTRRRSRRFLPGVAFLAVAVLFAALPAAGGEEFVKKSYITPGDAKPVNINADYMSTWTEGTMRVFLLRKTAWIEQGLIKLSMPEAVVWVDEARKKSTGVFYVTVYGEGGVLIREGAGQNTAGRVLLDMATRGELRIKARLKLFQTPMPNDPVYLRAKAEKQVAQAAAANNTAVVPASGKAPAPWPAPGKSSVPGAGAVAGPPPIKQTSYQPDAPAPARSGTSVAPPPPLPPPLPPAAVPALVPPPPVAPPVTPLPVTPPATTTVKKTSAESMQPGISSGTPPAPNSPSLPQQPAAPPLAPPPGSTPPSPGPGPAVPPPPAAPTPGAAPNMPPMTNAAPIAPPVTPGGAAGPPVSPLPPPPLPVPGAGPAPAPTGPPAAQMPPVTKPPDLAPLRQLSIRPRSSEPYKVATPVVTDTETTFVITNGVILRITNPTDRMTEIDMEADRVVIWAKKDSLQTLNNMKGKGETKNSRDTEFYLSGNVEIRTKSQQDTHVLRADEVYYDVSRNVAIALKASLDVKAPRLPYPLNIKADQITQLNPKLFQMTHTEVSASVLPSDPGLKLILSSGSLEDTDAPRRNIFGFVIKDSKTGEPLTGTEKIFRGQNMFVTLEGVPVFYLPFVQTDPQDPLGPLDNIAFNYNRIFGFQFFSTFNVYDLIGMTPTPGTRWQADIDYLSARGPAIGTNYQYAGKDMFFGIPGKYEGFVKAYGIDDKRTDDILGGNRGDEQFITPPGLLGTGFFQALPINHPELRGRFTAAMNVQNMPDGGFFQAQINALSDKNFLEQYFNWEYNTNPVQQTFAYGGQRTGNFAYTVLGEDRIRDWYTETNWLPKGDAYLLGQKFFDLFTYNMHAGAGYAQFLPTHVPPPAYFPTDVNRLNLGRFDLWQDISMPFNLGALKVVPYAVFDPTYYTDDVNQNDILRLYGGGGLRVSLPLSRLYPGVASDYFNLNGLYHKIVLSANYYNVESNVGLNQLPQLDRLNDDATDQALRNLAGGIQWQINPANSVNLVNNPLFNPQFYALRRLLDFATDTLQTIDVLQLDLRQRLQTKRGFPGNEHVVDWMTLDLGLSIFPQSGRDNFGSPVGIMNYDWTWNIGDSTSLVSNGWMDPIANAARVFTIGGNLMRPDRTNLYLGYRQIDPVNSKAVIANITYALNPKYALTASTIYDFGVNTQINTIALTRIGTDLQVSLGLSYNSILNTVGVTFAIIPNLFASQMMRSGAMGFSQAGGMGGMGGGGLGGGGGGMGGMGGMGR